MTGQWATLANDGASILNSALLLTGNVISRIIVLPQGSLLQNEQTELSLSPHPETILKDSEHMCTFKNQRVSIFYGILLVTKINL